MKIRHFSLAKAISIILFSTLLISGSSFLSYAYFKKGRLSRRTDPHFIVTTLIQKNGSVDKLPTSYLAELLALSHDRPINLYQFDCKKGEEKLIQTHLFQNVQIKAMPPSALFIDYTMKQPIAILFDFTNRAVDEEGNLFPLSPYYTPKKLPEIRLGLEQLPQHLEGKKWTLALHLIKLLSQMQSQYPIHIKRIDVANADAKSYGKREIVVRLEEEIKVEKTTYLFPRLLRLPTKEYEKQLGNYLTLRENLNREFQKKGKGESVVIQPLKVIDFRLQRLAYIK